MSRLLLIISFVLFANVSFSQEELDALPPAFSPDGDGIADVFLFPMFPDLKEMKVDVIDISGNIVFKCERAEDAEDCRWDGIELKGRPAPEGTYVYSIDATGKDERKYSRKGKIILKRNS